jgi:hypothetical protein
MWLEVKTIPWGEDGINEKIMLPRGEMHMGQIKEWMGRRLGQGKRWALGDDLAPRRR